MKPTINPDPRDQSGCPQDQLGQPLFPGGLGLLDTRRMGCGRPMSTAGTPKYPNLNIFVSACTNLGRKTQVAKEEELYQVW